MTLTQKFLFDVDEVNEGPPVVTSVLCGDCVELLPNFDSFDLIFADPPFNIGQDYANFIDDEDPKKFNSWVQKWVELAWEKTKGVLFLHGPFNLFRQYLLAMDRLSMPRIASGVWLYNFGQYQRGNFIDDHCHWIAFGRPGYKWNPDAIQVESLRKKIGDKRVSESPYEGMRPPGRVWGIPDDGPFWGRVQGNNSERWQGHPNQLPIRYLQRVIKAYTDPDDWVLDPFCGSGTTGLVCKHEKRNFIGVDISLPSAESARERISSGYYRH